MMLVSCVGKIDEVSRSREHLESIRLVRNSVVEEGIPREELFRRFPISEAKGTRSYVFGEDGRTTWELWELSGGYKVAALKYKSMKDYKVSRVTSKERLPTSDQSGESSWQISNQEHLKEVPPEMYFDRVLLFDSNSEELD